MTSPASQRSSDDDSSDDCQQSHHSPSVLPPSSTPEHRRSSSVCDRVSSGRRHASGSISRERRHGNRSVDAPARGARRRGARGEGRGRELLGDWVVRRRLRGERTSGDAAGLDHICPRRSGGETAGSSDHCRRGCRSRGWSVSGFDERSARIHVGEGQGMVLTLVRTQRGNSGCTCPFQRRQRIPGRSS